ncbi:MAG: Ig-like domain-containing protein [Myxococcales bacterium]|nr:Ig-like domain-containing protein [Myxococcales bacterium]
MSHRFAIRFLFGSAFAGALALRCDPDPTPDTTPPTVVASTPAAGAVDVDRTTAITVTFSEPVDPATVTAAAFTLEAEGAPVSGAVTLDAAGLVATFAPAAPLAWSTTYTATVHPTVRDLAGNALDAAYSWFFVTAVAPVPEWEQVGGQVSPADAESEDPIVMAIGGPPAVGYRHASFEARLAWFDDTTHGWVHEIDPTGGNIHSSIYGTPGWCNDGSRVWLAYSLAGDSGADDDTFYDRVFVQAWSPSTWTPQNGGAELSTVWNATVGGANAWEPAIACPPGGDPYVAWVEADVVPVPDTADGLWVSRVHAASADRSPMLSRIPDDAGSYATNVRTVGIAVDPAGGAVVAQWESDETEQYLTELYVSRWDGTSFTPLGGAVTDDWDYNNLCVPAPLVLDGEVYIAYSRANPDDYTKHVYVAHWTGAAWELVGGGPVTALSEAEHYDSSDPHLIAVEGELWVAWSEEDTVAAASIFVARWDAGAARWTLEGRHLNIEDDRPAHDPTLAYDADRGIVYCAFEEQVDGWPQIFVVRRALEP